MHDREYREEPLEKLVYRNYYTGSLVRLANPGKPFWGQILFVLAFTFVKIAKFRSWLPVKYLRTIFGQFSQIRASRMRTKCA